MTNRKQKYFELNTKISYLSDKDITKLKKEKESSGWGKNAIVTINSEKVFIKRIPVTKLEYDNQFDTANLYDLPTFYNYGIGSMGINCFRELAMHIKTTNSVLNDDIENFPLMYHYRIVKNDNPIKQFTDKSILNKKVKSWNNNKNVEKYIIARENAEYELVIFLEYFPYVLSESIKADAEQIISYITQMTNIINFLKKNNIIHFDAHVGNILSDGKTFYLTDFGLVSDMNFNLTKAEKDFFKHNNYYDYAQVMSNIKKPLTIQLYENKEYIDIKYNFTNKTTDEEFYKIIHDNLDEICKYFKYDDNYVQLLKKYWKISNITPIFHYNMRHNDKKDDIFPNDDVRKLLENIQDGGYYHKYQKYKHKYLYRLNDLTGGGNIKHILLDGTSSSGKSTLSKLFSNDGYYHIAFDDFVKAGLILFIKSTGNNYYSDKQINYTRKLMYEEGEKHKLVIYDDIEQKIIPFYKDEDREKLFVIVVYASLNQLVDNVYSRRLSSPRSLSVFDQYAKRYIVTESNAIDKIDKQSFINKLKEKLKYEFDSEENLMKFANELFQKIGIKDNEIHGIKLKDSYEYDYLINTSSRTVNDIYDELQRIIN